MTTVKVRVAGAKEYDKALKQITPSLRPTIIKRSLSRIGFRAQQLAATKYIRRGGGPPVKDRLTTRTGTLVRSIGIKQGATYVDVGSNVKYARVHELGIAPMPPRPFLKPAVEDARKEFPGIILEEWQRGLG